MITSMDPRIPLAAALLAVVPLMPHADAGDTNREIRIAERMQQETTVLTRQNAEQLLALLEGYKYNGLADKATLEAIGTLQIQLAGLADPVAGTKTPTMPAISTSLLKARKIVEADLKRKGLLEASTAQGGVIKTLERLVAIAKARLGGLGAAKTLEALIERQKQLKEETGNLSEETVGLTVDDLDDDLRTDLETLGDGQEKLRRELADTLTDLLAHADEVQAFQGEYAEQIRRAVTTLKDRDAAGLMSSAAKHIGANRLMRAGRDEGAALEILREALKVLNEEVPIPVYELDGGVPADIGPGPGGGLIDGAWPDVPPFENSAEQENEEFIPGIGHVPMLRSGQQESQTAWLVGLPEKERQILTSATEEKFPNKYAELLRAYYRALAGGREASK